MSSLSKINWPLDLFMKHKRLIKDIREWKYDRCVNTRAFSLQRFQILVKCRVHWERASWPLLATWRKCQDTWKQLKCLGSRTQGRPPLILVCKVHVQLNTIHNMLHVPWHQNMPSYNILYSEILLLLRQQSIYIKMYTLVHRPVTGSLL